MSVPDIRLRGLRGQPLPSGYVVGRISPDTGEAELIDLATLAGLLVSTGQFAVPSSPANMAALANNRVLGNTSGASAMPTAQALTQPAAGITITGGTSAFTFALGNDLAALEAMSGTGLVARTASETYAQRTITGTSNRLSVSNGGGVAGNPTLDIDSAYVGQASITTLGTIATGVWQGTAIAVLYGGTGQTSYTNGQLLIGNTTGNTLAKATLTAGSNVTITNGAGTITIAATGGAGGTGLYSQVLSATPTSTSTGLSTWRNQGGASVADSTTGVAISAPTSGVLDAWRIRSKASPGTPYTINALVAMTSTTATAYQSVGIGWDDGTKLQLLFLQFTTAAPYAQLYVAAYSNTATYNSTQFSSGATMPNPIWLQIKDDGTNVTFLWSADGANFQNVYTIAKASGYLGATGYSNVCLAVDAHGGDTIGTIMSWVQA